jgi:hypothetical protein
LVVLTLRAGYKELVKLPALRNADAETRLSTYLNDHRAGAAGGVELARRLYEQNKDTEYGPELQSILRQIEEDIQSLDDVMTRLRVEHDPLKMAAAWAAEKAGRLKLNGQLLGYSPLSRLVEVEGLMLGVTGKLALWIALQDVYAGDPRLAEVDVGKLVDRAREQRQSLEQLRRRCAREALT